MTELDPKKAAALAALRELPDEGVIGLGTGSTTKLFIDAIGACVRDGRRYVGVPTSEASRAQARSLGIPLLDDDGPWSIDVCVDGADEVDEWLNLIKGGGGAHTREKIVNAASAKNVIICDESKVSRRLAEKRAVPVEVLPFAHLTTAGHLARLGEPVLRTVGSAVVRTDSGNLIYDVGVEPLEDPAALERALRAIPGVVETGLFIARADVVLIASARGVERKVASISFPTQP
jgi:ribose 5-phosphate isomerase A